MILPMGDHPRLRSELHCHVLLMGGEPRDPAPVIRDNCALESLEAIRRFQAANRAGRLGHIPTTDP